MEALVVRSAANVFRGWLGAALLALAGGAAHAQIQVSVLDNATGDPVPYAHIAYRPVGEAKPLLAVSDPHGEATLLVTNDFLARGVALRISFLGFTPVDDTIYSVDPRTYRLHVDRFALDEVVVTSQYAQGTPEGAVQKIRVIGNEQVRRMAANNLGEALRNQLNMRLSQDNVLGSSVSMQGLGGENVKVLIDGVPVVGRQNGNVDLSQLDLTGIERIELVEGPLSVNYGTNALAGTINLITRKSGDAPATIRASAYTEHIGRLNTTVSGTRGWGRNALALSGGRNVFTGWDPSQQGIPSLDAQPADTNRYQQWKPREQYFGRLNYRYSGSTWALGYKGEAMHDRILDRGRPRAPYYETAFDAAYVTLRVDNALFAERRFAKGKLLKAHAAYNHYARTRNTWLRDLTTLGEELSTQPGMQDTTRFGLVNLRGTFASSPDSALIAYEIGTDINHETGRGERIGGGWQEIGDYAFFGSAEYKPIAALTIRPGVRYAYNTRYGAPLIPSLNMRWGLCEGFTMRASYAQGFRAPSLKELYFYFVDVNHDIVGNVKLEAERSHNASVSLNYRHAREKAVYTSELNGFYNAVSDLIALAQVQGTRYSYVNIGQLRTTGGSIGAGWDNGHWIVSVGAALTARRDALALEGDDPWLLTTEVRGSLTKEWRRLGWSGSIFWKYQGQQVYYVLDPDGAVARGSIEAFHMADASLSKRFWDERIALTAGCKDLFDVQNLTSTMNGGVHSSGGTSVPMTTGRTFFLKLELELKGKG
ncbi:MAG: TonB-dependent receptor [Flavobacteriales bacterium]|nr:TonB-dependent receptor [Flavobacteriales bacterium]